MRMIPYGCGQEIMADIRRRPLHKQPVLDEAYSDGGKEPPEVLDKDYVRPAQFELQSLICHLALMVFCVAAHVYDDRVFKRSRGQGIFKSSVTYGGRWKFLTFINFWLQVIYFFLAFITDLIPGWRKEIKSRFKKLRDFLFTTAVFPVAVFICGTFWTLLMIDKSLLIPPGLDVAAVPSLPLLNHLWHSTIVLCAMVEMLLVFHRYPSNGVAATFIFVYSGGYIAWVIWIVIVSDFWVYPFLKMMPPVLTSIFFAASIFLLLGIYFVGKVIACLRWGDRCFR